MITQTTALVVTLAIEGVIVAIWTRRGNESHLRRAFAAVLPSLVTHPFAWNAIGNFGVNDYAQGLVLIEALVMSTEAIVIALVLRNTMWSALRLSITANSASALCGWAIGFTVT